MISRMRKLSKKFYRLGFFVVTFLGGSMSIITSSISKTIE